MKTNGFLLKYLYGKSEIGTNGNLPSDSPTDSLVSVTYKELKDKRDAGKLAPGALYRITDYNCTTTQENTRSAGHLFDIVLLALSENKLAEEGWAMEHPTDIYTMICTDGVEFKMAFYSYIDGGSEAVDIVDINSLKAQKVGMPLRELFLEFEVFGLLDKNTKTIHIPKNSTEYIRDFKKENAIYNYFQNSNLSAWKVWYCLDNDKNRFAWADDNTTQSIIINNGNSDMEFERYPEEDVSEPIPNTSNYFISYAWRGEISGENYTVYTTEKCPTMYSRIYMKKNGEGPLTPVEHIGITGIKGFGRGVIYRLIDEFNNDIKYDFKNIQFKRKLTDGQYDATNGTDTWCYTLNIWYNNICQDASIVGNTLQNDEGYVTGVYDNIFGYTTAYDLSIEGVNTFAFALGNNVVLSYEDDGYIGIYSNTIGNNFYSNTIGNDFSGNTIGNNFYSNTIGNDFNSNTIGNNFNSNTIGDYFSSNIIGNNFFGKTISNNTSSKNYGNNGVELATKS